MSTSVTKKVNTTNTAAVSDSDGVSNVEKIVAENTPSFVSKYFNIVVENLESFRVNHFNSQYIFYPIFFIVIFLILRYLWRRFF